jgi:hypothetical protein
MIPVETESTNRTTLIVEFSGLQCNNCPLAAEEAHKLLGIYGKNLVVVEMHPASNDLTASAKPEWDYTCPAADEYYTYWNSPNLPYGVINMSFLKPYNEWGAACLASAALASPVELAHHVQITGKTLSLKATIDNLSDSTLNLKYIAWITEDALIGAQLMPDGKPNLNYEHNHILRASITDIWGKALELDSKESTTEEFTYDLPDNVNPTNCNIVGIVMKDNEAIQVNEYKLKNNIN